MLTKHNREEAGEIDLAIGACLEGMVNASNSLDISDFLNFSHEFIKQYQKLFEKGVTLGTMRAYNELYHAVSDECLETMNLKRYEQMKRRETK